MKNKAFMLMDATVGLVIIATAAGLIAASTASYNRAANQLREQRQLTHLAEQTLYHLQTDRQPPTHDRWQIKIETLDHNPPTPNQAWHRISVQGNRTHAELIGLAPPPTKQQAEHD